MTDERPPESPSHPPTLDPTSAGCLVPAAIVVAVFALAWFGVASLKRNSGVMSLEAAKYGLTSSGLPAASKVPFEAQIERLRVAHEADQLDAESVVQGVKGFFESRTIELLVLDDVRGRRIPDSGLAEAEKTDGQDLVTRTAQALDQGTLGTEPLLQVLGPLTDVPEDGSVVPLDDDGLRELLERAQEALASLEPTAAPPAVEAPRAVDSDALLERLSRHIDEALTAAGDPD